MTTYCIAATYPGETNSRVTFPEGKTWADVQYWYLKWNLLHVLWVGAKEYEEFNLLIDTDCINWRRPTSVSIYSVNEESDETDYDSEIATA